MILTQTSGIIMGPVTRLLGLVFNAIYNLFYGMGIESIALSIVVFTILIRFILFPFNIKQTRSSKIQQYLRPEFNKINKKYKGKKDQDSMLAQQKETRELQEKYGIKMTQGCLTSLLQFPVFIGLYNVIQNIPAYVDHIRSLYVPIANAVYNTEGAHDLIETFVSDNKITRLTSKLVEFTSTTDSSSGDGLSAFNYIIDVLYRCNDDLLQKVGQVFSSNSDVATAIAANQQHISNVNHFIFGINLAEAPGFHLTPALMIPIISGICQLLSMLVMPMNETGDPQQDAQMKSMRRSMYFMPIMSFIVTVNAPAGLGIYWATSAFISFLITVFSNLYYDHVDMEKIVQKQMVKAEKEIAKRKASGKKTFSEKMAEMASGQTEQEGTSSSTATRVTTYSNMNLKNYNNSDADDDTEADESYDRSEIVPKKGSLADKANAVKRFNNTGV
ncbi:MAG: YidC/Oxa1 family membrane protein insertase [Eubacterium sp.]|nr:YidC/Oxa1 family membrane protein insertase [Eubacterium sp.]